MRRPAHRLTSGGREASDEIVAEEVAVALVYNGISHAVMMATPADLEDLGVGFSLTERIVENVAEIHDIQIEEVAVGSSGRGIEVRLEISARRIAGLQARRRSLAGRTGCGLCGVESLDAALRLVPVSPPSGPVSRQAIERAMSALPGLQTINQMNGASHAAGWAGADGMLTVVREDVGRHNALDKLAGALARTGAAPGGGFVVVTSRCSYEMVQKAASLGAAAIAAVSAPTSLAIETAERAGIALAAFVREGRLTVYANDERITT